MIPSPSELHYFVEVANTLNISRAAERLGISQPSLSLAVKRLEDQLGTPLLIRSKSGVNLTRTGRRFVTQARALILEWETIRAESLRQEQEVTGRYSIGCHESVALYGLKDVVRELLDDHPELEIKLSHGLSRQVTDDVIGFKVDFGLVVNPVEHPDLVVKVLAKDTVELWTSSTPTPQQRPTHDGAVLISDPDLLQSQSIYKQMKKKGLKFRRTITSPNLEVITMLVANGAGVGIIPGRVASRDPSQKLKALGMGPKFQDRICLVYRADAQRSHASKAVIRALAKCLA